MAAVTVEDAAFSKIMLHCAKYPWSNVFGVLLCPDDASSATSVKDVIPLFHSSILIPMLEVGMLLINQHCIKTKSRICGAYYCGEDSPVPKKIVQQMATKSKLPTFLLNVVAEKVQSGESIPFQLLVPSGLDWKLSKVNVSEASTQNFQMRLSENLASKLADFDDSLDDASKDIRNSNLLK